MSKTISLNIPAGKQVPRHISIIMDGNNRWAKEHKLPSLAGHKAGVSSVRAVIEGAVEWGVESLTLFAFSSENWRRPPLEVKGLMELFMMALKREAKRLDKHNIRLNVIGDKSGFSDSLQRKIAEVEALTAKNTGLNLNVAANYGGQWDIVQAAQQFAQACVDGQAAPADLTVDLFDQYVNLADQPKPDLCIRTAGEQRVSNFLIWQMAYAELYFAECYWPDFDKQAFAEAIESYCGRQRRFGKTSEQIEAEAGV